MLHFIHQGYGQIASSSKDLLDCHFLHLVPRNDLAKQCIIFLFVLIINLDTFGEKLSGFFPRSRQLTFRNLKNINQIAKPFDELPETETFRAELATEFKCAGFLLNVKVLFCKTTTGFFPSSVNRHFCNFKLLPE